MERHIVTQNDIRPAATPETYFTGQYTPATKTNSLQAEPTASQGRKRMKRF